MVGLQAMVLGRLGCRPHPRASALSCPSPFAGRGSHTSQAGYGAPAFIMLLLSAAPVWPNTSGAAFALCPLCVARDLRWCDHDYPRWGGHTSESMQQLPPCSAHRLLSWAGAPWLTGLLPFALPRS